MGAKSDLFSRIYVLAQGPINGGLRSVFSAESVYLLSDKQMLRLLLDRLQQVDLLLLVDEMIDLMRHADGRVVLVDAARTAAAAARVVVQIGVGHAGDLHLHVVGEHGRDGPLLVVEEVLIERLLEQTVQVVLEQGVVETLHISTP